jgi:outer membrane murein-binding lipoprotein Lpp
VKQVKKVAVCFLILVGLVSVMLVAGCSREKAMEQLMSDPQMSQLIMDKLWNTPATKQQLVQMVMDDPESMNQLKQSLVADSTKAAAMMDMMLANENLKGMITEKTAVLQQTKKKK